MKRRMRKRLATLKQHQIFVLKNQSIMPVGYHITLLTSTNRRFFRVPRSFHGHLIHLPTDEWAFSWMRSSASLAVPRDPISPKR
jgi:hypothetical protein